MESDNITWTPEAEEAFQRAQADETGRTNPYILALELTQAKYANVNADSTFQEVGEAFDGVKSWISLSFSFTYLM